MKASCIFANVLFLLATSANAQVPETLLGSWTVQVENPQHVVITTLIIHFTESGAKSCMGGTWKQVIVDSYKTSDPQFFPVSEPLSYEFRGNSLSIGRNEICDAYLHLNGKLNNSTFIGDYIGSGWGSRRLGYFSMRRGGKQ